MRALIIRQTLHEPAGAEGRFDRRTVRETGRQQRVVNQMLPFALSHAPVSFGLNTLDVLTKSARGKTLCDEHLPQRFGQIGVLDAMDAIGGRRCEPERCREQAGRHHVEPARRYSQNSSLIPSWPYLGKFDCRTTVRSIEPNSAFVGLFSYCRSS